MVAKRTKWFQILVVAVAAASVAALGCGSGDSAATASFQELRYPGAPFTPYRVSADGGTVIGSVPAGDDEMRVLWRRGHEFVDAGALVGDASAALSGVSHDGRVVVGTSGERAFRWTRAGGTVWLPAVDGQPTVAYGVSRDGRVVVGTMGASAVIWVDGADPRRIASDSDEESYVPVATSADGRVVAGTVFGPRRRPFRWTASTGVVEAGDLPEENTGPLVWAISGDGRTICGDTVSREVPAQLARGVAAPCIVYSVPFCWTEARGMDVLPVAPFEPYVPPRGCAIQNGLALGYGPVDVNHDGSIVVGRLGDAERGPLAVLWDAGGPHAVADRLAELGVELDGWGLMYASGVSADGQTIVGTGVSPSGADSGWIAVVPRVP